MKYSIDAYMKELLKAVKAQKRSELSKKTKIGESTLRWIEKKGSNPTIDTLRQIEKGLK